MHLLDAEARVPEHVVCQRFPTETVMLNLQTGKYHGLNASAGLMLERLQEEGRVGAAAERVAAEVEMPLANIRRDIGSLCAQLLQRGMLELCAEPA